MTDLVDVVCSIPGYDSISTAGDCLFDNDIALDAISFIETVCTHTKGEKSGKPFVLEKWQKAVIANLFGWIRRDGTRRYREAFIYVPRGNGKTIFAAAIVNYILFMDNEPGAECYSSAAEREQAKLCFDMVTQQIRNSEEMEKRAELYKFSVVVGDKTYKALSAESGSKHGFNIHLLINDELHAHKTPELTEVLMTGTGKRRQPLVVHLTTADYERESICNDKYHYACDVRDGVIDDESFLPVIYEASRDDDWRNPKTWAKANPNLGISVPVSYIERECKRAERDLSYLPTFLRLHLNVQTQANNACIDLGKWDDCQPQRKELDGLECWGALDISSRQDLTSFVLVFPDEDGCYDVLSWHWIPEKVVVSRMSDNRKMSAAYQKWHKAGLLEFCLGETIDQSQIYEAVVDIAKRYRVRSVAYDPWNAEKIRQELESDGMEMVEFRQNLHNFTEPMKTYLALISEGKIRHGGNELLRWQAGNLVAYTDPNGNIRPVKEKGINKIDGQVATIMALGVAMLDNESKESIYKTRGFLTVG